MGLNPYVQICIRGQVLDNPAQVYQICKFFYKEVAEPLPPLTQSIKNLFLRMVEKDIPLPESHFLLCMWGNSDRGQAALGSY